MASTLPDIEASIIDGIFVEMSDMDVMLDHDPLEFGPKRLNSKVAEARDHLTRCEQIFIKISQWLQVYKRACRAGQLDFDLAMQDLMANDPETRSGRNVADRNAIATIKMRSQREDLDRLNVTIQDLDAVMTVVKSKRTDLRDVQGRLRDQVRLCQEDIGLGSRWGSKPATGAVTPDLDSAPSIDAHDLAEVQELLAFVEEPETVDVTEVAPPVEVVVEKRIVADLPVSVSQTEIDAFLDDVVVALPPPSSAEEISIDDLLDGI